MVKTMRMALLVMVMAIVSYGSAQAGWDPDEGNKARAAVESFRKSDPSLAKFFNNAYAYVIFPNALKGGWLLLGGSYGGGYAFEQGTLVGRASIAQGSVGPQLGAETFDEMIFFKDKATFDRFKAGKFTLTAGISAVIVTAGAATNTDYSNGVAVFVRPKAGAMADVTVGGQGFSYKPM